MNNIGSIRDFPTNDDREPSSLDNAIGLLPSGWSPARGKWRLIFLALLLRVSTDLGFAVDIRFSGTPVGSTNNVFADSATVTITSTFANRSIFYSLDGTMPFFGGPLTYDQPLTITESATVRALAVNLDDFSTEPTVMATATIVPTPSTYSVRLTSPGGSAAVDPVGERYLSNSVVSLRSDANDGWHFLRWEVNGDILGTNATMEIAVTRDLSIRAVFATRILTTVNGSGRIAVEPVQELHEYGSRVRVMPVPDPGAYFSIWGGDASGANSPLEFDINAANPTVSALFLPLSGGQANVYVRTNGNGRGTVSPPQHVYAVGDTVHLTALPSLGSRFDRWTGAVETRNAATSLSLGATNVVIANFLPVIPGTLVTWGTNDAAHTTMPNQGLGFTQIAAGSIHNLAIQYDRTIVGWGRTWISTVPNGLTDVGKIAAGETHSLALLENGSVVAWGNNSYAQIDVPADLRNVSDIAVGHRHSLALLTNGTVVAWGYNSDGQLDVPSGLSNVIGVAAGFVHSVALRQDGTVVAWGFDGSGQSSAPADLRDVVSISAGHSHNLALKNDGTVVAWGANNHGQTNVPTDLSNVRKISAGSYHNLALKNDGTVVAWGYNSHGQGTVPPSLTNVTVIAAGLHHNLAIVGIAIPPTVVTQPVSSTFAEGDLLQLSIQVSGTDPLHYQWHRDGLPLPTATNRTFIITNTVPAHSGSYHVVVSNHVGSATSDPALVVVVPRSPPSITSGTRALGTAFRPFMYTITATKSPSSFGADELPNGFMLDASSGLISGIPTVSGDFHVRLSATNAMGSDSVVLHLQLRPNPGVGNVLNGNQIVRSNVLAMAIGYHASAFIEAGGRVESAPETVYQHTGLPEDLSDATAIAAGEWHRLALRSDGTLVEWGRDRGTPLIPDISNVKSIAAGGYLSMALLNNGVIRTWGNSRAKDVPAIEGEVVAIAAGDQHALALTRDGRVVAWGAGEVDTGKWPDYGQSLVPSDLREVIAIAARGSHSLALKNDGTVVAWGSDIHGQSTVPADLTNVVAIAAGHEHSFALTLNGEVFTWGRITAGGSELSPPLFPGVSGITDIAGGGEGSFALVSTTTGSGPSPTIIRQPVSISPNLGDQVTLTISVAGHELAYQWRHNDVPIPGATNATLSVEFSDSSLAGRYDVVVSNQHGSITSRPAVVRYFGSPLLLPSIIIAGQQNDRFRIEYNETVGASTNWHALTNITHPGGALRWVDLNATNNAPNRFYRAVLISE